MQAFFFALDAPVLFPDARTVKTTRKAQMPVVMLNKLRPLWIFVKLHGAILTAKSKEPFLNTGTLTALTMPEELKKQLVKCGYVHCLPA